MGIVQRALAYIAEEMGVMLRNSSVSPNIRERLDMSCAILTDEGKVASQAEHIPVHLGSLAWASRRLISAVQKRFGDLEEGDVVILNDPYVTGTHLNDVTAITKVSIGWLVNKAHHVDIGGPVPGSLNPLAKSLQEEGIVIEPTILSKRWNLEENEIKRLSREVRNPKAFVADVKAQIASLREGSTRIREAVEKYGVEFLKSSIEEYIISSRSLYSRTLSQFEGLTGKGISIMETPLGDVRIRVRLNIRDGVLEADFSDTDEQLPLNVNAVEGVAYAATSFFLKALTKPEGPVDQGLYDVIVVKTREGTLLNPRYPAAVGAGNLETSQRALESLLVALSEGWEDAPSSGPGSMSNVIISWKDKVYYETNGGGGSATSKENGENAVQWGMTNTMNTPIEVLEMEIPILFTRYRVRRGSGGKGKYKGGDGIIRAWRALDRVKVTVMMSRAKYPSPGVGAEGGKPGKIYVKSRAGVKILNGYDSVTLEYGDEFILETPGGGGHS